MYHTLNTLAKTSLFRRPKLPDLGSTRTRSRCCDLGQNALNLCLVASNREQTQGQEFKKIHKIIGSLETAKQAESSNS